MLTSLRVIGNVGPTSPGRMPGRCLFDGKPWVATSFAVISCSFCFARSRFGRAQGRHYARMEVAYDLPFLSSPRLAAIAFPQSLNVHSSRCVARPMPKPCHAAQWTSTLLRALRSARRARGLLLRCAFSPTRTDLHSQGLAIRGAIVWGSEFAHFSHVGRGFGRLVKNTLLSGCSLP